VTIHQKFTGDPSQLLKAYQDLAGANARLEQQVAKLAGTMGGAGREAQRANRLNIDFAKNAMGDIRNVITGWLSLQGAISAVNMAIEHHKQLTADALATAEKLAVAQADVFLTAWGKSPQETAANNQRIGQIAGRTAVPQELVTQAFGAIQGAGIGTNEQQFAAIEMAAKLSGQKPQNVGSIAKSILFGQHALGVSGEEAAALFLSGGASAYVENPEAQSRMLRQVMATVTASSGGDRKRAGEQAIELGAALTIMVGEERGEAARTSAAKLSADLNNFFTEGIEKTVRGHKFRVKPNVPDPGGVIDRLQVLQNDPKLAKQFLESATFEAQFEAPIKRAILDKNSVEARQIAEAQRTVGFDTKSLGPLLQQLESGTPQIEQERIKRAADVRKQQHELARPDLARLENVRKMTADALSQTREFSVDGSIFGMASDFVNQNAMPLREGNQAGMSIELLRQRRNDVLRAGQPKSSVLRSILPAPQEESLAPEAKQALQLLDSTIAALERLKEQEGKELQKQTDVLLRIEEKLQPKAAGADSARALRGIGREQ
jgi:hypothetical protein